MIKTFARTVLGAGALTGAYLIYPKDNQPVEVEYKQAPNRQQQFSSIVEQYNNKKEFDILVIGGGATGAGCSLEAVSRGLSVALVEREDFASETSSKSTKLLHGGVRYLEKAIYQFSYPQLKLVYEALQERKQIMDNAPYLSNAIAFVTPIFNIWEVPYMWAGLKMYDVISGRQALTYSYYASPYESRRLLDTVAEKTQDGKTLKGSIIYYDGQFNDARLNLTLALSAASLGAVTLNYTSVEKLLKDSNGQVNGAIIKDLQSNHSYTVYAKKVINATGPFSDTVQEKSTGKNLQTIQGASGTHIILPNITAQFGAGLLIPKTQDGRVLFFLPWQGALIAGTTDTKIGIQQHPTPTKAEAQFILDELKYYLDVKFDLSDIQSAWKGIRPLLVDPQIKDTENLVRDHVIMKDENGLITIGGGKWTTYRLMSEETVNKAVEGTQFSTLQSSKTKRLRLLGAVGYNNETAQDVMRSYKDAKQSASNDPVVAQYLATHYGTNAFKVILLGGENKKFLERLDPEQPMINAEIVYGIRNEYVQKPMDFLARRSNLAFTNASKALELVPKVVEIMGQELQWSSYRKRQEMLQAIQYIQQNFMIQ